MDRLKKSHFAFLGLPERFEVDERALQQVYLRVQAAVHPDRHAQSGATEHRIAMQLATLANEAYRTLLDPGRRAAYLCELHGVAVNAETHTAMAPAFLMQQMALREALEEARAHSDRDALADLGRMLCDDRARLLEELAAAIDRDADFERAADAVRRWMFIDKFGSEVAAAEEGMSA
jgi:molecular chaperone HscB